MGTAMQFFSLSFPESQENTGLFQAENGGAG
jgi:hypothetical protein